jgi:hypothetical protein
MGSAGSSLVGAGRRLRASMAGVNRIWVSRVGPWWVVSYPDYENIEAGSRMKSLIEHGGLWVQADRGAWVKVAGQSLARLRGFRGSERLRLDGRRADFLTIISTPRQLAQFRRNTFASLVV